MGELEAMRLLYPILSAITEDSNRKLCKEIKMVRSLAHLPK